MIRLQKVNLQASSPGFSSDLVDPLVEMLWWQKLILCRSSDCYWATSSAWKDYNYPLVVQVCTQPQLKASLFFKQIPLSGLNQEWSLLKAKSRSLFGQYGGQKTASPSAGSLGWLCEEPGCCSARQELMGISHEHALECGQLSFSFICIALNWC